jgi:hypothetical protein
VGHLLSRDGAFEARDAQGKSLGTFPTLGGAIDALRQDIDLNFLEGF